MSNNPVLTLGKDRTRGVSVFDVEANPKLLEQLEDMGFERKIAEQALIQTKNKNLQAAMDWCLEHPEGIPTTENPIAMLSENVHHPILPVTPTINNSNLPVFPPSTVSSNRAAAENEKDKHKDKLRQQELEKLKREKIERQKEKERILQQMQEDREKRKQKNAPKTPEPVTRPITSPSSSTSSSTQPTTCTLQIRLPGGSAVRSTFQSTDTLAKVHKYLTDTHTHDPHFTIMTTFPHKEYRDNLLNTTLQQAELTPMGTITVQMITDKGVIRYEEKIDEEELDTDEMSYEQLLDLGERIGNVPKAPKQSRFELPTRSINEGEEGLCLICQCEYEKDETVRKLPCEHEFHRDCVDQWFNSHSNCPVCKQEV